MGGTGSARRADPLRHRFGWTHAGHGQNVGDRAIVVGHTGGTAGYRTFIGFDPEKRVGLVVSTNSGVELSVLPLFNLLSPPPATAAGR